MSKVRTIAKFAVTAVIGASGGFAYAVHSFGDYIIQPPTFANLVPRSIPKGTIHK